MPSTTRTFKIKNHQSSQEPIHESWPPDVNNREALQGVALLRPNLGCLSMSWSTDGNNWIRLGYDIPSGSTAHQKGCSRLIFLILNRLKHVLYLSVLTSLCWMCPRALSFIDYRLCRPKLPESDKWTGWLYARYFCYLFKAFTPANSFRRWELFGKLSDGIWANYWSLFIEEDFLLWAVIDRSRSIHKAHLAKRRTAIRRNEDKKRIPKIAVNDCCIAFVGLRSRFTNCIGLASWFQVIEMRYPLGQHRGTFTKKLCLSSAVTIQM